MKLTCLLLLTFALPLLSASGGQTAAVPPPPPAASQDSSLVFRSNTQLVVESVSAMQKNGEPLRGLTAKDFTITENGTPQAIAFCEYEELSETPVADAPALTRPPVRPEIKTQIAPEAPGTFRYKDRRLLVLYFDMSAMPTQDQLRSFDASKKFIQTQMAPADLLAIMKFEGGSVKVLQDFTDDRDALNTDIDKMVAAEAQGFGETTDDASTADTGGAFGQDDSEFNIFNTDRQLSALQTAASILGRVNEKKVLLYFASGLHLNGVDNQAQLLATTNAALHANVVFYSIDARGLVADPPFGAANVGSPGGQGMYTGASAVAAMNRFQQSQDTLYALAADTGGKAFFDNNDLSLGIARAQKALSSYYVLGYYTTNTALDGKFRKIKVSLNGGLMASLDFRQGYFGGKDFSKFTAADKERQLEDALMQGDPVTDLTIAMEVDYFQLNRAEYFVPVAARIPGSELVLAKKGGAERALIDFIGEVKDEWGTTVQNVRDKTDIRLSDATAAELAKRPVEYDTGFTLLPGTYTLKLLARDDATGRIGTYLMKFKIPNLNKEDKRIPISSVVLSSQRIDLHDAIYNSKKALGQDTSPLVLDGQKLIPSVTRVFSKGKSMYVYLQAYERTESAMQPLVAFVTFYRGQTKAFETSPLAVTDGLDAKTKAVPLRFSLALDKLPPGKYDCQVTVLNPNEQKASFWQAPIMVVP